MNNSFGGLAFAIIFLATNASAESRNCDVDLFKAHSKYESSEATGFFALHLVSEDNYDEAKKSGSAEFPGYFSGDYKEFAAKRRKNDEETRFSYNHEQAIGVITSGIDSIGLAAYQTCIEGGSELSLTIVKSPTEQLVALRVVYHPRTAIPAVNPLGIQVIGATPFGTIGDPQLSDSKVGKFGEKSISAGEKVYLFQRQPGQEFVALAQLTALNLAAGPVVLPIPPKLSEITETKGISTQGGPVQISQPAGAPVGKGWGPSPTCLAPEPGWSLAPNSEDVSFSEDRRGCVTTKKAFGTQSSVCFNVSLSINAGETCNAIWNVTARQTRIVKVFQ